MKLEIIIVGGGSILLNYDFRQITRDIDVVSSSYGLIKEAVRKVGDKYNLNPDWMNEDFKFTSSYSNKLNLKSKHYKSLNNNSIQIRTVKAQYLIAMKMQSDREFEHDVSDIIGIIHNEKRNGNNISFQEIMDAGKYLYENKFIVSNSLLDRVKYYTTLNEEQLLEEYNKSVLKSERIKEVVLKEDNLKNRDDTKEFAINIEKQIEYIGKINEIESRIQAALSINDEEYDNLVKSLRNEQVILMKEGLIENDNMFLPEELRLYIDSKEEKIGKQFYKEQETERNI